MEQSTTVQDSKTQKYCCLDKALQEVGGVFNQPSRICDSFWSTQVTWSPTGNFMRGPRVSWESLVWCYGLGFCLRLQKIWLQTPRVSDTRNTEVANTEGLPSLAPELTHIKRYPETCSDTPRKPVFCSQDMKRA